MKTRTLVQIMDSIEYDYSSQCNHNHKYKYRNTTTTMCYECYNLYLLDSIIQRYIEDMNNRRDYVSITSITHTGIDYSDFC